MKLFGKQEDQAKALVEETLRRLTAEVTRLQEENSKLRGELYRREEEVDVFRCRANAVYRRMPAILTEAQQKHADMERLLVLASTEEGHPLWQTVLSYADEHARNEARSAMAPGLQDDDRQYNAGRAAGAEDFASALRDLKVKAEREARKTTNGHE